MTHHDEHDDRRRDLDWRGDQGRDRAFEGRERPWQASQQDDWTRDPREGRGWSRETLGGRYGQPQGRFTPSGSYAPYGGAAQPQAAQPRGGAYGQDRWGEAERGFGGDQGWSQQHQFDRPGRQRGGMDGAPQGWARGGYDHGDYDPFASWRQDDRPASRPGHAEGYGPYARPARPDAPRGGYERAGWSQPSYGEAAGRDAGQPYGGGFVGGLLGAAAEAFGFGPDTRARGRGPKGYVRSDQRIEEDVNERLSMGGMDASEVAVAVKDGEVTLTGTVGSRWEKRRAEDLADDVSGVKHVQNNLRVTETAWGGADRGQGGWPREDRDGDASRRSLYADSGYTAEKTEQAAVAGIASKTTGA